MQKNSRRRAVPAGCDGQVYRSVKDEPQIAAILAVLGCEERTMKKLKHEAELFKAGLLAAVKYAQERGAVEFEPTDSASQKLLYVYRLLVHDKMIQPLPEDQVAENTMRHKLAIWYSKQLPQDHPLLK